MQRTQGFVVFVDFCFVCLFVCLFVCFKWMHYLDADLTVGEEARRQLYKNVKSNIEQVLAATPHKAPTIRSPTTYHENYTN